MVEQQQPPSGADGESHLARAYAELGSHAERFKRLHGTDDHGELLEALRSDRAFALAVTRADAITYLRTWFPSTDGWKTNDARSGAVGAGGVAVEWTYAGVHDGRASFNGLSPTGRPVLVRGVTMVGVEESRLRICRYVDWAGVFAQLGLSLNWRVPVPSTPLTGAGVGAADGPAR